MKEIGEPLGIRLVTQFASLLPASTLVWGGLNAFRLLWLDGLGARDPDRSMPQEALDPAAEFWERLPKPLGRAVEELGKRGHRVHRSH